jgi:hypothetical protein
MTRTVRKSSDITIVREYRVLCPTCGQVDVCTSQVEARDVRWSHWLQHREAL